MFMIDNIIPSLNSIKLREDGSRLAPYDEMLDVDHL